jgi:oligosaccharide repeat unit polymerase
MVEIISALILFVWAYFSFWISKKIFGNYFAPLGLFLGVNLASLALFHLKLLPFIPLRIEVYLLVLLSFLSFCLGALIISYVLKWDQDRKKNFSNEENVSVRGLKFFYYFSAITSLLAWLYYIIFIVPPEWISKPWLLQGSGQADYVMPFHTGYLILLGAVVPPAFVLLSIYNRRISFFSVVFLICELIALSLTGIKSYLTIGLSTSLLALAIAKPSRAKLRYFFFTALGAIGFMAIYDQFIDVFALQWFSGSKFPTGLTFLERPYLYIAGPWAALSRIIEAPPNAGIWGQTTLEILWKIVGPGGLGLFSERVSQFLPFIDIGPSPFNVYSLIGEVYWEYGWFGPLFICFLLGFISTLLFILAQKSNQWVLYLAYAIFAYGLLISFFAYYYRSNLIFLLLYTITFGTLLNLRWIGRNRRTVPADSPKILLEDKRNFVG